MAWMDPFWADLIQLVRTVEFGVAAVFAAWSACSLPSIPSCPGTHSIWMLHRTQAVWSPTTTETCGMDHAITHRTLPPEQIPAPIQDHRNLRV
jgi:hypothetical protein